MTRLALLAACVLVILAAVRPSAAQSPSVEVDPAVASAPTLDPTQTPNGETGRTAGGRTVTPLVAPIPFKNSQLGWGLFVMGGLIHRFDADTTIKPSTGAVGGFYSENDSWGLMALEMARLAHDAWRLRGLYSHVDVNYDFFGIGEAAGDAGIAIPLEQTLDFAVGSSLHRFTPGFYGGAALMWMRSAVDLRGQQPADIPALEGDRSNTLVAPGLQGEFDTRDDDYWPGHGSLAMAKAWFFLDGLGGSREFQRYLAAWCWYTRLRDDRVVLATNVHAAAAAGDAPFYMLPTIGSGLYGLRGYTQGRYRDNVMTTAQAELRVHSEGRWGATVFGGFAQVAPDFGSLPDAKVLPAGGLGLRFQLTRQFPMHMRLDYAWGNDEPLLYFSVGEAF